MWDRQRSLIRLVSHTVHRDRSIHLAECSLADGPDHEFLRHHVSALAALRNTLQSSTFFPGYGGKSNDLATHIGAATYDLHIHFEQHGPQHVHPLVTGCCSAARS